MTKDWFQQTLRELLYTEFVDSLVDMTEADLVKLAESLRTEIELSLGEELVITSPRTTQTQRK